jgi:hypothetical protein
MAPPNALQAGARIDAAAGGKIALSCVYSSAGELGACSGLQVARVVNGAADWAHILQTIVTSGSRRISQVLTPAFANGETVLLSVRAITAEGGIGPETIVGPVAADSSAPPSPDYLVGAQKA